MASLLGQIVPKQFTTSMITLAVAFFLMGGVCPSNAHAGSFMDRFVDPRDGKFDCGDWLLNHKGFLPVPAIITEPAVGYGLGGSLLFFHDSIAAQKSRQRIETEEKKGNSKSQMVPPSVSGAGAFKTENDTWGAAGFHFGSWKKDRIRYLGAVGKVSMNLKFYGTGEDSPLKNGIDYNLDGWGLYQDLKFRIAGSKLFLGGRATYFDTQSTFQFSTVPSEVSTWELDFKNAGLGFVVDYDSRDNPFTPDRGTNLNLSSMFYNGEGLRNTTREYQITDAKNTAFWKIDSHPVVMGWKVGGRFSAGNAPFYALPFIDLRGIPKARYQDTHAIETELEARYQVSTRWGLVGFGGVGRTADTLSDLGSATSRWAGGVGFRYLVARVLKLHYGVDIAKGPEDWAIYFTVGSGL